ncbi:hypothetical protein [Flavobacterium degerlachei]|jgi:hypothetical protein|uniref:Uncharacterized protein n=1 Tax=Flavobacterium degerlachei TaxID=229203 RepID=A0A1H3G8H3_9FLAO|nr:hypothetical protein [Flavobacterium degerlachei]SDX99622.1 hypothetical protein SAMN05444338_1218 [Flavobacterium degerlachei]
MENNDTIFITIEEIKNDLKTAKWTTRLDDYNNYVKEYIKHYKKSLKGNPISLAKYPYMKIKSELLAERIKNAEDKSVLTKKQIKRFLKINTKLESASYE